ncbi:MAG TPA: cytochrome-c oxidase, cbb3-type subunit II [Paenalcaligenes sp.]|nr:cytochrome-c oxidase, cbb3-type subunit II [Paenalcaligenes sp.]
MSEKKKGFTHATIERNAGLLIVLSILVISFAGLAQIVPLFFQHSTTEPVEGVTPYEPLRLVGRDIYIREGCVGCHSQQIRMLQSEVQRYGPYSLAGEGVYEHPFLWGSKRTGPDLARVGGVYTDNWHRIHLRNPRDTEPASNMPAYPWLQYATVEGADVQRRMSALRSIGVPYTDEQIEKAPEQLVGKTEEDALIAYLQGLGVQGRAAAQRAVTEGGY